MALALRTMVVPSGQHDAMYDYRNWDRQGPPRREWVFHVQAGAGVVADSDPESEYQARKGREGEPPQKRTAPFTRSATVVDLELESGLLTRMCVCELRRRR